MPNEEERTEIITTFETYESNEFIESKCSAMDHYWTEWNSHSDLSKDGNDDETFERHRERNTRLYKINLGIIVFELSFSLCKKPTEIDARVIKSKYDWMYSGLVLVHLINSGLSCSWNTGASKNG